MSPTESKHEMFLRGMALVHTALRRSLDTIVRVAGSPIPETDRAAFADFAARFVTFLEGHHDSEEQIIFPALEKGFADQVSGWRADHQRLLDALSELRAAIAGYAGGGSHEPVARAARAVREVLVPHLDAEEKGIDAAALARTMSGDAALALAQSASKHGQRHGGPRLLVHFLHGLTDEEQRAHFGAMPWFVRRILVKRIWDRGYRPLLKYAHNPSIAL
jgi:hemerythrin-like domain-containing protein